MPFVISPDNGKNSSFIYLPATEDSPELWINITTIRSALSHDDDSVRINFIGKEDPSTYRGERANIIKQKLMQISI